MIRLNMLPDVKREYLRARQSEAKFITGAILLSAIAAGIVLVIALYVYGAQTFQKSSLTNAIKDNMSELKNIKDIDKYVTIQNQLTQIDSLHDKKTIYSRLFDILPKLNPREPNSVKISSLSIEGATSIMGLDGQTTSFTALETFRDTLKNAKLSYRSGTDSEAKNELLFQTVSIVTQSIGKDTAGKPAVTFTISTIYNPAVFARSTSSFEVTVPSKETTQSKEDAPDVFGQSTVNKESQ